MQGTNNFQTNLHIFKWQLIMKFNVFYVRILYRVRAWLCIYMYTIYLCAPKKQPSSKKPKTAMLFESFVTVHSICGELLSLLACMTNSHLWPCILIQGCVWILCTIRSILSIARTNFFFFFFWIINVRHRSRYPVLFRTLYRAISNWIGFANVNVKTVKIVSWAENNPQYDNVYFGLL